MSAGVLTKTDYYPSGGWKVEMEDSVAYGKTKADAVYTALELNNKLDKIYENMSTRSPITYLNQSRRYR